jgi:hypothetical protein
MIAPVAGSRRTEDGSAGGMGIRGAATSAAVAVGAAAVATGSAAIKKVVGRAPSGWGSPDVAHEDPRRWRAVTVNRPIAELEGALPGPLAELGDAVEVRLQPAPGNKGTELHARLAGAGQGPIQGQEPLEALRSALRRAKQVAEVGYVLEADLNTTTKRTPLNEPLRQATKHAGGEGRL